MSISTINWAKASGLPERIWLASKSPRRKQLIQTLGIDAQVFLAQESDAAEALEAVQDNEHPLDYVERVTTLKLQAAIDGMTADEKTGVVLAADTTVARGGEILGKPQNEEEARFMLRSLSDQSHQVHTCVAVTHLKIGQPAEILKKIQTSDVHFSSLPDEFIAAYVASGEPFDKAGGYGIQGVIAQYITFINGSHSGIMGLPLCETALLLRQALQPSEE